MTVLTRAVRTNHPTALASLQALAHIAGLDNASTTFSTDAIEAGEDHADKLVVEMIVSAHNSFNASSSSYTASGLLECARVICKAVPEIGLWGQMSLGESGEGNVMLVEEWIESAVSTLSIPAYVLCDDKGKFRFNYPFWNLPHV